MAATRLQELWLQCASFGSESRYKALEEKTNKNGPRHTVFSPNGDHYTGEWSNNLRHGLGTQVWKREGAKYIGQWKEGRRHGNGILYKMPRVNKKVLTQKYVPVYQGNWKNNKKEGFGMMYYSKTARYEGVFVNNVRSGWGKMIYENGDVYEGQWANDERNGWGMMIYENGAVYEGEWANDERNGLGKLVVKKRDYEGASLKNGDKCESGWKDGKKHGQGEFTHKDSGKVFEGFWKDDYLKHGTICDLQTTTHTHTQEQNAIPRMSYRTLLE